MTYSSRAASALFRAVSQHHRSHGTHSCLAAASRLLQGHNSSAGCNQVHSSLSSFTRAGAAATLTSHKQASGLPFALSPLLKQSAASKQQFAPSGPPAAAYCSSTNTSAAAANSNSNAAAAAAGSSGEVTGDGEAQESGIEQPPKKKRRNKRQKKKLDPGQQPQQTEQQASGEQPSSAARQQVQESLNAANTVTDNSPEVKPGFRQRYKVRHDRERKQRIMSQLLGEGEDASQTAVPDDKVPMRLRLAMQTCTEFAEITTLLGKHQSVLQPMNLRYAYLQVQRLYKEQGDTAEFRKALEFIHTLTEQLLSRFQLIDVGSCLRSLDRAQRGPEDPTVALLMQKASVLMSALNPSADWAASVGIALFLLSHNRLTQTVLDQCVSACQQALPSNTKIPTQSFPAKKNYERWLLDVVLLLDKVPLATQSTISPNQPQSAIGRAEQPLSVSKEQHDDVLWKVAQAVFNLTEPYGNALTVQQLQQHLVAKGFLKHASA